LHLLLLILKKMNTVRMAILIKIIKTSKMDLTTIKHKIYEEPSTLGGEIFNLSNHITIRV